MAYTMYSATVFCIYAIAGVSLNLVTGFTGLISVAHAAFFGIGAYATAILVTQLGVNFFLAIILGMIFAAIVGWGVSAITSRLGGDYYVLGTVSFNLIVINVFENLEGLTHGLLGIPGIPKPALFGISFSSPGSFLILAACALCLVYVVAQWVAHSSFGRVLKAIREDEEAIRVFGYRTLSYKILVFMIAAAMVALAGGLYASFITFIEPSTFNVMGSVFMLAIVILGGLASINGSLIGAFTLVLIPELLRFVGFSADVAAQMRQAIYGLILVLLMLYRPRGLIGEYKL